MKILNRLFLVCVVVLFTTVLISFQGGPGGPGGPGDPIRDERACYEDVSWCLPDDYYGYKYVCKEKGVGLFCSMCGDLTSCNPDQ